MADTTDTNVYKLTVGKDALIVVNQAGFEQCYLPSTLSKSITNLQNQLAQQTQRINDQIAAQQNLLTQYNNLLAAANAPATPVTPAASAPVSGN